MGMRELVISAIDRRLQKIDGSTFSTSEQVACATAVVDALRSLRGEVECLREPFPAHACQDCGSVNFHGSVGNGISIMICDGCGKTR